MFTASSWFLIMLFSLVTRKNNLDMLSMNDIRVYFDSSYSDVVPNLVQVVGPITGKLTLVMCGSEIETLAWGKVRGSPKSIGCFLWGWRMCTTAHWKDSHKSYLSCHVHTQDLRRWRTCCGQGKFTVSPICLFGSIIISYQKYSHANFSAPQGWAPQTETPNQPCPPAVRRPPQLHPVPAASTGRGGGLGPAHALTSPLVVFTDGVED